MEKGAAYHEEEQLSAEFILLSVKIGVSHDLPPKKESTSYVRIKAGLGPIKERFSVGKDGNSFGGRAKLHIIDQFFKGSPEAGQSWYIDADTLLVELTIRPQFQS